MTDQLKTWEYMYFADSAYGRDQRDGVVAPVHAKQSPSVSLDDANDLNPG